MRLFIAVTVFLCAIGFANSHISSVQKLAKELMKEKFSGEPADVKCSLCLNVMDEGINAALNLILSELYYYSTKWKSKNNLIINLVKKYVLQG